LQRQLKHCTSDIPQESGLSQVPCYATSGPGALVIALACPAAVLAWLCLRMPAVQQQNMGYQVSEYQSK